MADSIKKQSSLGGNIGNAFDLYIRMNDDSDRDYCFNVDKKASVSQLMEIFETLPMPLSPSYFYNRLPEYFRLSNHPGFLTSEGALLFARDASLEKYTKVINQSKSFEEVAWEGQLFVPVWTLNYRRLLSVLSVLGLWLYSDLPQYMTPTPGISAGILLSKTLDRFSSYNYSASDPGTHLTQWFFFILHLLKVAVIFFVLYIGILNPISLNPLTVKEFNKHHEINPEKLLSVGWTGAHRTTPRDWRAMNSKAQIDKLGGVGAALNQGILGDLRFAGVYLGPGEGWDTPLNNTKLEADGSKFYLTPEYYAVYFKEISEKLHSSDVSDKEKNSLLKEFRSSGPVFGPAILQEAYKNRKKFGHNVP